MFRLNVPTSVGLFLTLCIAIFLFANLSRLPLDKNIATRKSRERDLPPVREPIVPLHSALEPFPWTEFNHAIDKKDEASVALYSSKLLSTLTPYVILEPLTPINETCSPPPLTPPQCKIGSHTKPRKVGVLVQFGFNLDTLEIYLNEVYDVIDKFFILESTHTYSYMFKKDLVWEAAMYQERFYKFSDKIVHLIVDDADSCDLKASKKGMFDAENFQELSRWQKFLKWNDATHFFDEDDLLVFGDSDEIPSREVIQYLKHCVPESDPIDIGAWFLFGSVDTAFRTDFPVRKHPFTYGDPTFWTLKVAKGPQKGYGGRKYPSRNRGQSDAFIIGGTHMTDYPYFPNVLAKRLTMSEQRFEFIRQVASYPLLRKNMNITELEKFYTTSNSINYSKRIKNIRDLSLEEIRDRYIPWFYECNRKRYPGWEGKHDSRLY